MAAPLPNAKGPATAGIDSLSSLAPVTLIVGGARSGKSAHGEALIEDCRAGEGAKPLREVAMTTASAAGAQRVKAADIRAPMSVSDRGPEANSCWKFSEPISAHGHFVGLFPGQCPLSRVFVGCTPGSDFQDGVTGGPQLTLSGR